MAFWEPLGSFPGLQGGLCGHLGVFGGLGEASFRLRLIFAFDILFGVVLTFSFSFGVGFGTDLLYYLIAWIFARKFSPRASRGFSGSIWRLRLSI